MKTEFAFGLWREAKRHAALEKHNRLRKAVSLLRSSLRCASPRQAATTLQNIASLLLCVLALIPAAGHAANNDLTSALQKGLFEEEANRNLDAAISNYQSLAAQFDQDRQVAATAIFRLGECYRKLGQTNNAVVQYQRIIREFSDQKTLATLSQQNLTGLGVTSQPRFQQRLQAISTKNPQDATVPTTAESAAGAATMEAEAASLKTQIEHLTGLKRDDCRIAIQQNFSNPVLTKLMQDLTEAEQKLAVLTNDYSPTDLHITRVTAQVDAINGQIDAQVEGVIKGLQAKMEADLNAAKVLREQSRPVQAVHAETSMVADDEDQEIRRLQAMIQNSPDLINAPASDGFTPLGNAARNGQIKVATFLLDHGAGINVAQRRDVTALHGAARAGNRAMVELLLSRGAEVNSKEVTGQTPLHIAADKGFQAVVEVLLANKIDVNAQDDSGNTPLHLAGGGQAKIIQMLLAAGANPNAENKLGRTPLSFAAENGSPESVKLLLAAKADPNGGKLDAPLLCAVHKQDVASIELLLEKGANANAKGAVSWEVAFNGHMYLADYFSDDRPSVDPLWLAVSTKQLPMVQVLLKFKADPNDSQTDGRPLLFNALSDTNILEVLLDAGAKVDVRDKNASMNGVLFNWTLLDAAILEKAIAAVKTLLAHGADPNAHDASGNMALHWAANPLWGQLMDRKLFELLLDHGANPNVRNDDGYTPLDWVKLRLAQNALSNDTTNASVIADLLRQHGALDNLPHWDRITVSRPSANYSRTVFQKGTNDWNRFTLLETLLNFYAGLYAGISPGPGSYSPTSLPLPDLTRVTIIRHKQNTTNEPRIKVDLLNSTNGIDCTRDVPLEFGDVVEIPEREHALGDEPIGLTDSQRVAMANCLTGSVQLVVRNQKVKILLYPDPDHSLIGAVLDGREAKKILLSSSDLSRVKVTRRDPKTGKRLEWEINCITSPETAPAGSSFQQRLQAIRGRSRSDGQFGAGPDLWLRDGDVIEVPEK